MAENDYNSVPLGQAGTGAAYILPDSQAINSLNQFIDQRELNQRRQALLQQQQAAAVAAGWKNNQLKIKGGTLFQDEINKRSQGVMDLGLTLQKAGVNPNTTSSNPKYQQLLETYQNEKAALLRDVDLRDAITAKADASSKLVSAQAPGYFDPEAIANQHKFIDGSTPLSEISAKGLQFPELQKMYNLADDVGKLKSSHLETTSLPKNGVKQRLVLPNETAHAQTAKQLFETNPEAANYLQKQIGMPVSDLPATDDKAKLTKQIDDYWRSQPNVPQLANMGIPSYDSPQYKQMVSQTVDKLVGAKKKYDSIVDGVKQHLDDQVNQTNDKSFDFEYQKEMRARRSQGMQEVRFADWLKDQQEEAGSFEMGNQSSYVPTIKTMQKDGKQGQSFVEAERGASLFGINLPAVDAVVRPSMVTDTKTGKTEKNTGSMAVKVSQIQMVPVFKDLGGNDPRNGSEISARQLREISEGKHNFASLKNITFQPFAYGIKSEKDKDGVHTVNTPIKFSYDALKGGNAKKINTKQFDLAKKQLQEALESPDYKALTPAQRFQFLKTTFNIQE